MYACLCRAVTEQSVREVVAAGASTVSEVRALCGAGTGCGGCSVTLRRLLRECRLTGLACTAGATLDPFSGQMESTCSGNCAEAVGTLGEPMCVAGLGDRDDAVCPDPGRQSTTVSFA